ncbi:MAG: hypothetical protein LBE51_06755 [Acidovorax sp.]|jgi:hypothetical protein|nr:hypothetical protein [Acidovorax sp.]
MPAKRAARAAASRKSEETRFVPMKRTEPSKHATDQKAGFKYANAVSTDIRKRFAVVRRQLTLAQRAADDAQTQLDLGAGAQVLPFKAASNA